MCNEQGVATEMTQSTLVPTERFELPGELVSKRRSEVEAEASQLLEQFKPHVTEWSGGLRKFGRIKYESQHWRVRVCLFGGKPVGFLIKQRKGSVEELGTVNLRRFEKS